VDSMLSLLANHETKESIELCQLVFKIINRVLTFTAKSYSFIKHLVLHFLNQGL